MKEYKNILIWIYERIYEEQEYMKYILEMHEHYDRHDARHVLRIH